MAVLFEEELFAEIPHVLFAPERGDSGVDAGFAHDRRHALAGVFEERRVFLRVEVHGFRRRVRDAVCEFFFQPLEASGADRALQEDDAIDFERARRGGPIARRQSAKREARRGAGGHRFPGSHFCIML
ncbi:MAG TPA: hypothetical protein VHL34_04075 [Rhizomicrobium sp.]|nr:hypothetical protein [Rhizomicrobium sp.]